MAIVWALVSAVLYGVSDYAGGRASRRMSAISVTLIADVSTMVALALVVPRLGDPVPPFADLAWGGAAGLAGVVGILSLYHALANGAMTVVAPITAVVAAGVPVSVGLATGDRPGALAIVGIVVALVAVALVSGAVGVPHVRTPRPLVGISLLAGLGFGLLFVAYDRAGDDSGWWPLLAARMVGVPILFVAFVVARRRIQGGFDRIAAVVAVMIGVVATTANIAYIAATRQGLLSIVAVVTSLYPASTVMLATWLDGERLRRPQVLGLALTAVALAFVTLGR